MMRRLLAAAVVTVGLTAGVGAAAAPVSHATSDSLNWAGYVDAPKTGLVSNAAGDFAVPRIQSDLPPGVSSTWVGIGGYTTSDLIQAGVAENSPPTPLTGSTYYAWYELLPASETALTGCRPAAGCPVNPGDRMHVAIDRVGVNRWRITVVDAGHWSWQKTVSYVSSGKSAEWIAEASSIVVPLTYGKLATTRFDHGSYTVAGHRRVIRAGNPDVMTMTLLGVAPREATPSALDRQGDGFNVCAYATQCPAPAT